MVQEVVPRGLQPVVVAESMSHSISTERKCSWNVILQGPWDDLGGEIDDCSRPRSQVARVTQEMAHPRRQILLTEFPGEPDEIDPTTRYR